MALRDRNTEKFEQMDGADTATVIDQPAAKVEVAAPKTESTAVAAVKPSAVAVAAPKKFKAALAELENAINPGDMTFGTFPKITPAAGGAFMLEGETSIGEDIVMEVLSWNRRFVASPGSNDPEAKDLAKFSIDGVHIDGEDTLLIDYVRELKVDYPDAKIKEYFAIWGELISDKNGIVPAADRHIVELQCSPETVKKFNGWRMEHGMKVARGIFPESNVVKCHANTGKNGKNTFGYATFTSVVA